MEIRNQLKKLAEYNLQQRLVLKKSRALRADEISQLEKQGNIAFDWSKVRISGNCDLKSIVFCQFDGPLLIKDFYSEKNAEPVFLSRSYFKSAVLEGPLRVLESRVRNSLLLGKTVLENSSLCCREKKCFGFNSKLVLGPETGERAMSIVPEIKLETAYKAYQKGSQFDDLPFSFDFSLVEDAFIENAQNLDSVFIRNNVKIQGAAEISCCFLQGSAEQETGIGPAVILRSCYLEEGAKLDSAALGQNSVFCRGSGAAEGARVHHCVVGQGTKIQGGEAHSSLLGPQIAFHHQSLLISAIWPQGHGNIAYGAMVGSNHTSRRPDQIIMPGEGAFFGLGCRVQFPSSFAEAPFSLIATAVDLLPQRLEFPFSLISRPRLRPEGLAEGYNHLIPAWMIESNFSALLRNNSKFRDRGEPEYSLFRPEICRLVLKALRQLEDWEESPLYLKKTGMGKNFCFSEDRQQAIKAYRFFLDYAWYQNKDNAALLAKEGWQVSDWKSIKEQADQKSLRESEKDKQRFERIIGTGDFLQ